MHIWPAKVCSPLCWRPPDCVGRTEVARSSPPSRRAAGRPGGRAQALGAGNAPHNTHYSPRWRRASRLASRRDCRCDSVDGSLAAVDTGSGGTSCVGNAGRRVRTCSSASRIPTSSGASASASPNASSASPNRMSAATIDRVLRDVRERTGGQKRRHARLRPRSGVVLRCEL
jgi:hypothetical protein